VSIGLDDDVDATVNEKDTAIARFHIHPVQNDAKSATEGRPVFDDVEYVEIRNPGDKTNIIDRPLRPEDKMRFRRQYAHWAETKANITSGTPLSQWPQVTRGQVEELNYFGVSTVEQLANLSDDQTRNIGPIMALRTKAQDFIKAAKSAAPMQQMRRELEQRDQRVKDLEQQIADQAADLAELKKHLGGDKRAAKG